MVVSVRALVVLAILALLSVGPIRSSRPSAPGDLPVTLATPRGTFPAVVYQGGPSTVAAYQAAIDHPDVLASVPCLCGCQRSLQHANNLDCYLTETERNDMVAYATHGINCTVCQEITRIALAGAARGLSGRELKDLVLNHYGVRS